LQWIAEDFSIFCLAAVGIIRWFELFLFLGVFVMNSSIYSYKNLLPKKSTRIICYVSVPVVIFFWCFVVLQNVSGVHVIGDAIVVAVLVFFASLFTFGIGSICIQIWANNECSSVKQSDVVVSLARKLLDNERINSSNNAVVLKTIVATEGAVSITMIVPLDLDNFSVQGLLYWLISLYPQYTVELLRLTADFMESSAEK